MKFYTQTIVGLFTIGAAVLFLAGIFFFGGRDLLQKDTEYVVYFDGSVGGLAVGSPVVLRGVPLGKVTRISLVTNPKDSTLSIPVHFNIDSKSLLRANGQEVSEEMERRVIRRMVDLGLRAHLEVKSIITGQLNIELDFQPEVPAAYHSATPDMEIPSAPSAIDALQKKLSQIPFEKLTYTLDTILSRVAEALDDGKLKDGLAAFSATFEETHRILSGSNLHVTTKNVMQGLDSTSQSLAKNLPAAVENFNRAMGNLAAATAQANLLLDRNSSTVQDLRRLLRDGAEASRSLRNLADMLERNPEALLKGKKGGR